MTITWPEIIQFTNAPVPPFPLHTLPPCLREYAAELAEAYQVPSDLPAMLMLAAVAVPLAGVATVQAGPEWIEPTNIFVAVAMPPSNRKSSIFKAVSAPIVRQEQRIQDELQDDTKSGTLIVDDVTPEKLSALLSANNGRLAIMSAEGGMFDNIAGRYSSRIPNLDIYLKGHAGDRVRVDRINRPSVVIDSPSLTIGLAVQPDVLGSLSNTPGFRGRGLIARFLYSLPPSLVGKRKLTTTPIHPQTKLNYDNVITGLFKKLDSAPLQLTFSNDSMPSLDDFRASIESELLTGGRLAYIEDWGGKLAGAVVRIAGIIHCARHGTDAIPAEISPDVTRDAISIGEYLINHALAVFDLMGADPVIDNARHLLDWVSSRNIRNFSGRDVLQSLRGRFRNMTSLRPVLDMLLRHGYLVMETPKPSHGRGRPAGPQYLVNPQVFTQYSHNAQKFIQSDKPVTEGRFLRFLRLLSLHRYITATDASHQREPGKPPEN